MANPFPFPLYEGKDKRIKFYFPALLAICLLRQPLNLLLFQNHGSRSLGPIADFQHVLSTRQLA